MIGRTSQEPPAHTKSGTKDRTTTFPGKWQQIVDILSGITCNNFFFLFSVLCRKLSSDEIERKRREMMEQAKQREEERENNVKRYKTQDEKEKLRNQNAKHEQHAGFIQ